LIRSLNNRLWLDPIHHVDKPESCRLGKYTLISRM
jgi:hypothetical protein